VYVDVSKWWYC